MSDVLEVSYVFHRNDVGRLQTVTVDIKRELYLLNKIWVLKKIINFGMRHLPHLPQCSYGHAMYKKK